MNTFHNTLQALEIAKRDLKADLDTEYRSGTPDKAKIEDLKVQLAAVEERRSNIQSMADGEAAVAEAARNHPASRAQAPQAEAAELGAFLQASVGVGERSMPDFYEARGQSITAGSGGGYLIPVDVSGNVWESITNESRMVQAGVRVEQFGEASSMDIVRVDATAAPSWRAENSAISDDAIELGVVRATPQSLAVLVKASWEVVSDSAGAIERLVVNEVTKQFALAIDSVIYNGTGAANQPTGIVNWAGIGTTGSVGPIAEADVAAAALDIMGSNFKPNAAVMGYREYKSLSEQRADAVTAADAAGGYLGRSPFLDGVVYMPTNQIADTGTTTALVGQFDQAVLAVRQQLSVLPLKERYADTGQIAWVFHARADVVVMRPAAFHSLTGITA